MLFLGHVDLATDPSNIGSNLVVCLCASAFQNHFVYQRMRDWEFMCEVGDCIAGRSNDDGAANE
jgi:hypothetical protein